eukprot:m.586223 g.586223  ORF g.586223 m.586223 type:complete len:390 (+) comp22340_c0_seq9:74-1243(+)
MSFGTMSSSAPLLLSVFSACMQHASVLSSPRLRGVLATTTILPMTTRTCPWYNGNCQIATGLDECTSWAASLIGNFTKARQSQDKNSPLGCYLYGESKKPYYNDGHADAQSDASNAGQCTDIRRCVCMCNTTTAKRVALYTAEGTTERGRSNTFTVLNQKNSGIIAVNITAHDLRSTNFLSVSRFDVVYFPGGGGNEQADALGTDGRAMVAEFISSGGGYVGVCAGAYLAIQHLQISGFADMPRPHPGHERGDGNCTVALSDAGSAAFGRFGVLNSTLVKTPLYYANGPVMEGQTPLPAGVTNPTTLVHFTSNSVPIEANYTGPTAGHGAVAVAMNSFSNDGSHGGRVLVSGPHPETNEMNYPETHGPPSTPGSVRAHLLHAYVFAVAA